MANEYYEKLRYTFVEDGTPKVPKKFGVEKFRNDEKYRHVVIHLLLIRSSMVSTLDFPDTRGHWMISRCSRTLISSLDLHRTLDLCLRAASKKFQAKAGIVGESLQNRTVSLPNCHRHLSGLL